MERSEFEEKQYEVAALWELANGSTSVFPSGQVLESLVGYDAALDPGPSPIWSVLGSGQPTGIQLTPALWLPFARLPPAAKLPSKLVSLILQFKTSEFTDHWKAGQYHHWRRGYYRFWLHSVQQLRLETLEDNLKGKALVRYAAPAFLQYSDLLYLASTGNVCGHSAFVSAGRLTGHRLWSYAGPGTHGYANPEGEETPADTFESLLGTLESEAAPQNLAEHVIGLADVIRVDGAMSEFAGEIAAQFPIDYRSAVAAWIDVARTVASTGSSWLVVGF